MIQKLVRNLSNSWFHIGPDIVPDMWFKIGPDFGLNVEQILAKSCSKIRPGVGPNLDQSLVEI